MKICVLGAGAWGSALAVHAAGAHAVTLWARDGAQAQAMRLARQNTRYLPGVSLPASLTLADGPAARVAAAADLLVIATPMGALRVMLGAVGHLGVPLTWLCKGVEPAMQSDGWGLLAHEVCEAVTPQAVAGVLSGPSFAQELAQGRPTAMVAASRHAALREMLIAAFHGPRLRVYANDDIVGVEVGGAVKNVLAIATGVCDGLQLGANARAALVTRGLAEMTRFGLALGAREQTFMGLSGLGDLVLTATGDLSRNRRVGLLLAGGATLAQAVASLGHVAEGVHCARVVVQRARHLGVEMPIAEAVVALLDGRLAPQALVERLMAREPGSEVG